MAGRQTVAVGRNWCWFCRSVGSTWESFASPELEHRTGGVLVQDPVALPI